MTRKLDSRPRSSDPSELPEEATEIVPVEATLPHQTPLARREVKLIGEYVLDGLIGEGGGGRVYAARHLSGERVAIKVLRPEMVPLPHLVTRFDREVAAIQQIAHPNIVQVLETGRTEHGQPYYVMELLEGVNLRRLLQLSGRLSPAEVLQLFAPICSAVQAVHDAGFVHRDIKASNVHVTENGSERSIKLLDFGIAKAVHGEAGPGLTEPGVKLGSAHTMAPEQVRCEKLDARADIYALGVMLFQLLTGEYPFDAEDPRQIALLHLQAPAPRPSTRAPLSPAIDAVVLRCLDKQAERRFASASELLTALRAAIGSEPEAAEQDCAALGVLVELGSAVEELDDAMLEDMASVLDQAEQCLANHGFRFPLHTATSLLAVRVAEAGEDLDQALGALRGVLEELASALAERAAAHPDVQMHLALRQGGVRCQPSVGGSEPVGGGLLELDTWLPAHRLPG